MFGLGATELAIILVLVLVVFGGRRLPELGQGLGSAIRNFRKAHDAPGAIGATIEADDAAERDGPDASEPRRADPRRPPE